MSMTLILWKAPVVDDADEAEAPQGPDVTLPGDPVESGPIPPIRLIDHFKILLIGLAAAGVFWLGWRIDVPVLDWLLMIIGGFVFSVVVFLVGILIFGPKPENG